MLFGRFNWNEKPGTFCASDAMIEFCEMWGCDWYRHLGTFVAVINGRPHKLDYTPAVDGVSDIIATAL